MKNKKFIKILSAIIFSGFLILLSYFIYTIIKNRYFQGDQESKDNSSQRSDSSSENTSSSESGGESSDGNSKNSEDELESVKIDTAKVDSGKDENVLAHITTEHCDNECKAFATDLVLFEYCEEVCGIKPASEVSNCDGEKDMRKDYCLKNLAITKKDASLCNEIDDSNIKRTCKNRILEDLLENQ
jgi:hypothetical protein